MEQDRLDYEQFLSGDKAGFERLVLRYKDGLIQFLARFVRDLYQAEDLAQDTFVEVLLHPERYRKETSFKTYIYTIGHNKAVDYIRRNDRLTLIGEWEESDAMRADALLLEEKVIREEEKRELYAVMKQLKPDYERVLYLVDLEGVSYADAAQMLGKSDSQIKVLIHRARKRLKQKMEEKKGTYTGNGGGKP